MMVIYSNKPAAMLFENGNRMNNHGGSNLVSVGDDEFDEREQIQQMSTVENGLVVENNNIKSVRLSNGVCIPLLGVGMCWTGCARSFVEQAAHTAAGTRGRRWCTRCANATIA